MTARFKPIRLVLAAALALIPLPGGLGAGTAAAPSNPPLGLMGTIPIYWGEARQLDDLIGGAAIRHWARAELERGYQLRPVDYLDATALDQLEFLLLAQPRALSGEENVALDAWVREVVAWHFDPSTGCPFCVPGCQLESSAASIAAFSKPNPVRSPITRA